MKHVSLVTLDCEGGLVRRYWRGPNNKPRETGRQQIARWTEMDPTGVDWNGTFWAWLQTFRTAWTPPEEPGPRPTPPLRTTMRAAA